MMAWGALPPAVAAPPADGKAIYAAQCARCHQPDGKGLEGKVPPLAGSPYLNAPDLKRVSVVLNGLKRQHPLRAWPYDQQMKAFRPVLNDAQIAAVVTYVGHSWGNKGPAVSAAQVRDVRHVQETGPAAEMWQEAPKGRRSPGSKLR
jgi:mono/diheme cytochrome c family protein